jgi:hypothetical protein
MGKAKVINILIYDSTKEIEIVSPMSTAEAMKIINEIAESNKKETYMVSKESKNMN